MMFFNKRIKRNAFIDNMKLTTLKLFSHKFVKVSILNVA